MNNSSTYTCLVQSLVDLMQTLNDHYEDGEKALAVFDSIANIVDPKIKGDVLMHLLRHGHSKTITISGKTGTGNAVPCIKAIREVTHLGLKEAKDIYDGIVLRAQIVTVAPDTLRSDALRKLRDAGLVVF